MGTRTRSKGAGTKAGGARIASALGLSLAMLGLSLAMAGCVGYVRGPGGIVVAEPDFFLWGRLRRRLPRRLRETGI